METYRVQFVGKCKGAIGCFETFSENATGENVQAAILSLKEQTNA